MQTPTELAGRLHENGGFVGNELVDGRSDRFVDFSANSLGWGTLPWGTNDQAMNIMRLGAGTGYEVFSGTNTWDMSLGAVTGGDLSGLEELAWSYPPHRVPPSAAKISPHYYTSIMTCSWMGRGSGAPTGSEQSMLSCDLRQCVARRFVRTVLY